jgi:hypothetical protein
MLQSNWRKIVSKVEYFFLTPASARPLAALRIGIALVLIIQALCLRASSLEFLSQDGLIQGELAEFLSIPNIPRLSVFIQFFSTMGIHLREAVWIYGTCTLYFIALVCLFLGYKTRIASVCAWFLHWTLLNTGHSSIYGVDQYAHVFLFYLMWMPVGDVYSVDSILRTQESRPSAAARLGLRVVQLHLCVSYLSSAIEKGAGPQWWDGELLWRTLSLPVYHIFDMNGLAYWPFLSKMGGWITLLLEGGYCIFIWPKATRRIWVLGITGLHLGIAVMLGLGLFGAIMCVLTLTIFGVSAEPQRTAQSRHQRKVKDQYFPDMQGAVTSVR